MGEGKELSNYERKGGAELGRRDGRKRGRMELRKDV